MRQHLRGCRKGIPFPATGWLFLDKETNSLKICRWSERPINQKMELGQNFTFLLSLNRLDVCKDYISFEEDYDLDTLNVTSIL